MKYAEAIAEEEVLVALDGMRGDPTPQQPMGRLIKINKFNPMVRLGLVMRLRKVKKYVEIFNETRVKIAEELGVLDKKGDEVTEEQRTTFQKSLKELLEKDCGLPAKKWTSTELNIEQNDIPIEALEFIMADPEEPKKDQE